MITTVCKISYGSQTVPPIVPAVQGDTGRAISFEIADFTPPAGATATYFIMKPSGEAIYNSATITDNSILCELTAQSLAEAGENRMQVRVLLGEDIVTSFEVILMVRTFLGDDAIESGTEMNIFDQAVEQATEQFQENAEQIVEEVIESIPVDYTELTEEVDELNERIDAVGEEFTLFSLNSELVYVSGGVVTGSFNTDNTRIRSMPFVINNGDIVKSDGTYSMFVAVYNSITQSTVSYYEASGSWGTADIELSKYAGKLGVVVVRKVGSETTDISADVPTINGHITLEKLDKLVKGYNAVLDTYGFTPVTDDDLFYANISTAGVITWLVYPPAYSNALTRDIIDDSFNIVPLTDDVMFRIVKYDNSGNWVENSAWYSKSGTTISTATTGILATGKFRIMIATATQNQNASVASMLKDFGIYAVSSGGEAEDIVLPFSGFRIDIELHKIGDKYTCDVNPYANFVTVENGVVGFISADGSDSNSGLDVLHPKKTLSAVLGISNIQTIVFAEGTYTAGTHFTNGMEITQAVNLIGDGQVIIDNGTGSPLNFYRSIFCDNIHFRGGSDALVVKLGALDRTATFIHCKFSESKTSNGLTVQGGTCICIGCEAFDNAYDGFNYHMYSNIVNHSLEVDCKSYGNGTYNLTGANGQSSNASTTHDGSYIVRVNGDYKCCHGGIIADKDSYSANYGCSAGVSTITDATYPDRMSNFWSRASQMYLYDCRSYGSKYDTAVVDNGTITSNITYPSNYTA